jgi:hypothetical protein
MAAYMYTVYGWSLWLLRVSLPTILTDSALRLAGPKT